MPPKLDQCVSMCGCDRSLGTLDGMRHARQRSRAHAFMHAYASNEYAQVWTHVCFDGLHAHAAQVHDRFSLEMLEPMVSKRHACCSSPPRGRRPPSGARGSSRELCDLPCSARSRSTIRLAAPPSSSPPPGPHRPGIQAVPGVPAPSQRDDGAPGALDPSGVLAQLLFRSSASVSCPLALEFRTSRHAAVAPASSI